jgi:succinylarginine dihydrolase
LAWGRQAFQDTGDGPKRYPARQTLEASMALARGHGLDLTQCFFPRQSPEGIDAGAFHTDVLAAGNDNFLMLHEDAFVGTGDLTQGLRRRLGSQFHCVTASEAELPLQAAVEAYPFNSQLLTLPSGSMAILAPAESREREVARCFLERIVAEDNPVKEVHYLDLRQSMRNGGGPACLRLRVILTDAEREAVSARVFLTPALLAELTAWVKKHYRDRLSPKDLADPLLARESMAALDELTGVLRLGNVYDFQGETERHSAPTGG